MKLLVCLLVLTSLEQIIAPQAEPCQVEGTTRLFTTALHPQLCNNVGGILEWSYFCGNFRMSEGKTFCKTLGYPSYQSDGGVSSEMSNNLAKIENLNCIGNETKLADCSFTETTDGCKVAVGLVCVSCSSNSMCGQDGVCIMNGTCVCREGCDNGGYCYVGRCICPEGLGGPTCNECDPPCQNGGECSPGGDCQCIESFGGPVCELDGTSTPGTANNTVVTLQTTASVNSTIVVANNEYSLVIGIVVISLIFSCTFIITFLGVLVFLVFLVTRMKPALNKTIPEQKEMPILPESNGSIQIHNESPNHDYCYIQDSQVSQSSSRSPKKQTRDGYYEIESVLTSETDENHRIQISNSNSSPKQADTDQGHYVIDDVNEL